MFDIFTEVTAEKYKSKLPAWDYIKRQLNDVALPKIESYYRGRPHPVPNQHLIVSLLRTMNIPISMPYMEYVFRSMDAAGQACSSLRISHPISTGQLWESGVFYNNRCKEIIVGHSERFDVDDAVKNWRSLEPIKVLRHDYSDLSFSRCDGKYSVTKEGWAVISINVPMLMLQYRRWLETEAVHENGSTASSAVFVGCYPITNMVRSHVDLCIWNRWVAYCRGLPFDSARDRHPFGMPDMSSRIDDCWPKLADVFYEKTLSFQDMLRFVPLVSVDSMHDRAIMPKAAPTRNVTWAFAIALLPIIAYVVDLNIQFDNKTNTRYLNELKRDLIQIASDNLFRRYLPRDAYLEIRSYVQTAIEDRLD